MATEETALTTSVTPAPSPAGESVATTDAGTLARDTGVGQVAQAALDQATPDPIEQALTSIPESDDDLQAITDTSQRELLTGLRGQLRVLGGAVRELQPLRAFQQYGDPAVVTNRLEIAKLLYNPLLRDGKPVIDPETRIPYVDPKPFVDYLDRTSPGLPEALLVALLHLETENPSLVDAQGNAVKEPLINQVFRYHKLDPRRLPDYQNIDTLIARTNGAITPDELVDIPAEYHAAYRIIPASIRAAWKSMDEADQAQTLEDYKLKLDLAAEREQTKKDREAAKAADTARYQAYVAEETEKYLDTVRRERTASMLTQLAGQVSFSTDPVTNKVMLGSLMSTMAQLFDPAWRFVVTDEVLTPLGLKLDSTFDQALAKFDESVANTVAFRLAGDSGRAKQAQDDANAAANQLMAKIAIFALKVAAKQGATVAEKATTQAAALSAATAGRPGMPAGSTATPQQTILPAGMIPGSREATEHLARATGFFRETPA